MFKPPRSTAKQTMPSCAGPATPASTRPTSWPRATSAWSSTGVPTGRWAAARIIAGRKPTCTARMLGEKGRGDKVARNSGLFLFFCKIGGGKVSVQKNCLNNLWDR